MMGLVILKSNSFHIKRIMEILLSLVYREANIDLNLILLDEPDSHIHRDIQKRLLESMTRYSSDSQIFITTHNESLIRDAAMRHLFYLENKPKNHYKPINDAELTRLTKTGRFKGIYLLATNSIIRSLGHSSSLDFINAIEADRIIFVEGEEDAQALYLLLQESFIKNNKKYVFWVLNGISHVFKEIDMYHLVRGMGFFKRTLI